MRQSDSVQAWLNSAARRPLLTPEQEIQLGRTIRRWQDFEGGPDAAPAPIRRRGLRARNRMVEANLRLVSSVEVRTRRGGSQEDRLQCGALGLVRAAERFDPERGYRFSTYAYWWIRRRIVGHVETSPTPSGIRIPPEWAGTEKAAVFHRPALRIDGDVRDDSGDGGSFADLIPDDRPTPDLLAVAALEAMLAADADGLALLELQRIDGNLQSELADLESTSGAVMSKRLCSVRQRFRRMPEVAAALA